MAGLCVCRAERSWAQGCAAPPGQALLWSPPAPHPLLQPMESPAWAPHPPPLHPGFISAPSPPLAQPHGYLQSPPPTGDTIPSPGPLRASAHASPPHGTPLFVYLMAVPPANSVQEPSLTRELGWCPLRAPRAPGLTSTLPWIGRTAGPVTPWSPALQAERAWLSRETFSEFCPHFTGDKTEAETSDLSTASLRPVARPCYGLNCLPERHVAS